MGLTLAFKAFMKAFKEPKKAKLFVEDTPPPQIGKGDTSHLRLLQELQQGGRFIDFLKEDLSGFNDAEIGAVVRKVHQDCAQTIEHLVTIRPLRDESEGAAINIPKGYDPTEIKLIGKVKGEPPFTGTLVHRGWCAQKRSLPKRTGDQNDKVICPAEVEVKF